MADSTATDKPRKSRFAPQKANEDGTSDTSGAQTDGKPPPIKQINIPKGSKGTSATSGAQTEARPPPKANVPELAVPKTKPETAETGIVTVYDNDLNYKYGQGEGIIIVNENFKKLSKRSGAKKDLEYLTNIYEKYNIKCDNNTYEDLEGSSFFDKLDNLSDNVAESCSVIFVSISSHGDESGKVLGSDGFGMTVLDMVDILQSNENLLGIPKVFIMQACKGSKKEVKYKGADSTDTKQKGADVATKAGDTLIAYSTSEGFVSWRDPKNGSWFLKILHDCVMDPRYRNLHLVEILTVCSNLIITECAANESGYNFTETPSYYSTLRRFLRFNQEEKGDKKALK
ncbi:Caspase-3-like [Oopsacas minuta]|uniref:Caspase-3-like n=1 Tax=Oopsacas minuta TaxID=111878 RepID=A0AAV7JWM1_9METZ|nr:Caspase-3-like [Oopsacas minuta]